MGCPENIAGLAAAPGLSAGLVLYVAAQCAVLLAQDRWGPRFFLPSRVRGTHFFFLSRKCRAERIGMCLRSCCPQYQAPRYNYYVRLPEHRRTTASELEAGLQPDGGAAEEVVCLICMSAIDQTTTHMVTPCRHSFHSACLERVRSPGAVSAGTMQDVNLSGSEVDS